MGRRSRKNRRARPPAERPQRASVAEQADASPRSASTPAVAKPSSRRRARGEAPKAPWHPFPLVEICVLIALVLGIVGLVIWGQKGQILVACAAVLGSLAGLELAIR